MIVRTLAEAEKTDRCVKAENGNWQSVRLSLKEDGMGHSFNITTIFKGIVSFATLLIIIIDVSHLVRWERGLIALITELVLLRSFHAFPVVRDVS